MGVISIHRRNTRVQYEFQYNFVVSGKYYFNCGGPDYTDAKGHIWKSLTTGTSFDYSQLGYKDPIPLWTTVMYNTDFTVPLPAGNYMITCYTKEVYHNAPNLRTSLIKLGNGTTIVDHFEGFIPTPNNPLIRKPAVYTFSTVITVDSTNILKLSVAGTNDGDSTGIISALSFKLVP